MPPTQTPPLTRHSPTTPRRAQLPDRVAPFRPGALWRSTAGDRFRVARDGARIHYAQTHGRRNVVLLPGTSAPNTCVPDELLRLLLDLLAELPEWAQARRTWRVQNDTEGHWLLDLELRALNRGASRIPAAGPAVIAAHDGEAFAQTARSLWAQALDIESRLDPLPHTV